jgi:predicted dehydrogenase
MTLGIALIGAGNVGSRRAATASRRDRLVVVADTEELRATQLAHKYGARHTTQWEGAIHDPSVDAVAVCTSNKSLAPISIAALSAGKHVLCEKPMGRNALEAAGMAAAARDNERVLKVGFTLRFHPAVRRAHQLCAEGLIGPLFLVHGLYGHGGRTGYESEWRGDAELAGGGELLDQGVHLLDLSRWFLGDLRVEAALTPRWYWDVAPLEDNALILLQGDRGEVASLHTSWTMWRNRFSFEVVGRDGYMRVNGLGGSYGVESLTVGRRTALGAVPEESVHQYSAPDTSWDEDWADFRRAISDGRPPEVDAHAGLAVMGLVEAVYAKARQRATIAMFEGSPQ